jgi:glutamate racemase
MSESDAPRRVAPASRPPIGVFDSGVGGLTVLRALREVLLGENYIYLGDTARLPYGTKSAETVARYSLQCAAVLVARGIGCLVVACNTASASALEALSHRHPSLPVIGVIEPGAHAAVAASASGHIAVIATEATIRGGAYQRAIHRLRPDARVTARACSLFVSLAEEGWVQGAIARSVARRYLEPMFSGQEVPDTLVLGCTHFPVLIDAIRAAIPAHVRIVDSAATTAREVLRHLGHGAANRPLGGVQWLATDGAERFARIGATFFCEALTAAAVEIVDL